MALFTELRNLEKTERAPRLRADYELQHIPVIVEFPVESGLTSDSFAQIYLRTGIIVKLADGRYQKLTSDYPEMKVSRITKQTTGYIELELSPEIDGQKAAIRAQIQRVGKEI